MQDWFNPDPIGALEQNLAPNSAVQSYWQETLDNLTSGRPGVESYKPVEVRDYRPANLALA